MKPIPGSIDSHFYSSVIFIFIQYFCNYYLCVQIFPDSDQLQFMDKNTVRLFDLNRSAVLQEVTILIVHIVNKNFIRLMTEYNKVLIIRHNCHSLRIISAGFTME